MRLLEIPDIQWTPEQSQSELVRETNDRLRSIEETTNENLIGVSNALLNVESAVLERTFLVEYQNNKDFELFTANSRITIKLVEFRTQQSVPVDCEVKINSTNITTTPALPATQGQAYQRYECTANNEMARGDVLFLRTTNGLNQREVYARITGRFAVQPF